MYCPVFPRASWYCVVNRLVPWSQKRARSLTLSERQSAVSLSNPGMLRTYGLRSSCLKEGTFVRESMGNNGRSYLEKSVALYERDLLCPRRGWGPCEEVDFFKERECAGSWAPWVVNILTWVKSQDSPHILMSNLMTCSQWFAATITGESGPAIIN